MNTSKLSNKELLSLAYQYGTQALVSRRQFLNLLPELNRRELYKPKFYSIYEYAAKLGGVSRDQVNEVIRVNGKLADKPSLQALIETQGYAKVGVVASIATVENQEELVSKVKQLPKKGLLIEEIRKAGYKAAETHFNANGIKSDISLEKLIRIIKIP